MSLILLIATLYVYYTITFVLTTPLSVMFLLQQLSPGVVHSRLSPPTPASSRGKGLDFHCGQRPLTDSDWN